MFADRHEAGNLLAERLRGLKLRDPVVLALPRGGVPVGFEIARALGAPLDLVLVRKIGMPFQPELAIGAVAEGPELVTHSDLITDLNISPSYLEEAKATALKEIERRRRVYLGSHLAVDITGRTAIIVDDGIATGATMRAALRGARHRKPAEVILAVPVAPEDTLNRLRQDVDMVICLDTPTDFMAVGQFYRNFDQLTDAEVVDLLDQARAFVPTPPSSGVPQ
ncbi:MAG TPA: phosphoribosyltransferase [Rhodopila sp.]|nr:phosphoribosyltransferase [Rhodopila sp.]